MFCSNCGNEVNLNSKFCNHCGAPVESTSASQQNVYQDTAQPVTQQPSSDYQQTVSNDSPSVENKPVKKKRNVKKIIISLVIVFVVYIIANKVIAPLITNSYLEDDTSSENTTSAVATQSENNDYAVGSDEYDNIFLSRNIVDSSALFFTANNTSFAKVDENNNIDKRAFGYNDQDVIEEMVLTQYYCITGYTADEIADMDAESRSMNFQLESLSFCEVTYHIGADYYSVTATFSDLDDSNNLNQLKTLGIVGDGDYLSMIETESSMLSQGYAKK